MARAIWSGALSFGLVAMPVQLYSATENHAIRFHQIQRGTSDRVRNKRVNERTGEEVPADQIVKGFDMGDTYVVVEPEELDEIAPGRSRALEITEFVELDAIHPVFFDRTYYLAPKGKEYDKVYGLLREALASSGRAGVATVVMRNREYLVAVVAEGDVLAVHTLHWADEVRDPRREIGNVPEKVAASDKELRTAVQLVEALSADWDPEEHHDTYQERVARLVEAKSTGRSVEKSEAPPSSTNVINLMDALQASVDKAGADRAKGGKAAEKASGKGGGKGRGAGESTGKRPPTELKEARNRRARTSGGRSGKVSGLESLTKAELYKRASDADVQGRSSMSREELVRALSATGSGTRRRRTAS